VSLHDIELTIEHVPLPDEAVRLIDEASKRIEAWLEEADLPTVSFVPSDFSAVSRALKALTSGHLASGNVFCEWGSGFGVVTCVAELLGFEAYGIEIQRPLVEAARCLARDFELSATFVHGSFVQEGGEELVDRGFSEDLFLMAGHADTAYADLGIATDELDVVFVYPWSGEEEVVAELFDTGAADGALLITYGYLEGVRIRRKRSKVFNSQHG